MKKAAKFLIPLILGLLIIASIFWYLFIYDRAFTRDTLLQQARQTSDDAARVQLYKQFQTAMAADPAYTYIAYIDAIYAGDSNITGIVPDQILGHHGVGIFWNIYEWDIVE